MQLQKWGVQLTTACPTPHLPLMHPPPHTNIVSLASNVAVGHVVTTVARVLHDLTDTCAQSCNRVCVCVRTTRTHTQTMARCATWWCGSRTPRSASTRSTAGRHCAKWTVPSGLLHSLSTSVTFTVSVCMLVSACVHVHVCACACVREPCLRFACHARSLCVFAWWRARSAR
jgi:hypothetical protein